MKKNWAIYSILIALILSSQLSGQANQDTIYERSTVIITEFGLDLAQPMRTYATRVNGSAIGFSSKLLVQKNEEGTLFFGAGIYYHNFESYEITSDNFFNWNQILVNERASTHNIGLDFLIRKYPSLVLGRFELYVEGSMGIKWLYTTVTATDVDTGNSLNFDFEQNDLAFNYGANIGLQVYLNNNYFINTSVGYFGSTTVSYHGLDVGNNIENTIDAFRLNTSLTDVLRYNIGMTFTF